MVRVEPNYNTLESNVTERSLGPRNFRRLVGIVSTLALTAVACVVFTVAYAPEYESADFESLEAAPSEEVHYGDYIALKNAYNEYVLVGHSGRMYTGGYHASFDHIQILSAENKEGPVQYGDSVAFVGQNDKFCSVKNSGKMTCRASQLTKTGEFTILGGAGTVKKDDVVHFKGIYGYVTARNTGVNGDTEELTTMERYRIETPGDEDGLELNEPLRYGMTIFLRNYENEYLQTDPDNGWVGIGAADGKWDQFDVLSPLHRKGPVRYGDKVMLRAHNDNMVWVRDGKLTAYKPGRTAHTVFTFIGGNGLIKAHSKVALGSYKGFVNGVTATKQAYVDPSSHYNPSQNWELMFAFRH